MSEYPKVPDAKREALDAIKDSQRYLRDYIDDTQEKIHPRVSDYAKRLTAYLEAVGNAINSGMVAPTEIFRDKLLEMEETFEKEAKKHGGYAEEQIENRFKR